MSNRRYISIDAVLYDISTMVDETMWKESDAREWITKGLGKIQTNSKYDDQLALLQILEHKSELPREVKYVNQILYKKDVDNTDLTILRDIIDLDTSSRLAGSQLAEKAALLDSNSWKVMHPTSSNFLGSFEYNITYSSGQCDTCEHEYFIHPDGCMDISAKTGYMLLSYKTYPRDKKGSILIPDNENLKEALTHYYFYRYWMTRAFLGDTNAAQERNFNLERFSVLGRKAAGDLNNPDIGQLENIRRQVTSLVPTHGTFNSMFTTLSQREKINF